MPIPFNTMPASLRHPGFFVEADASMAGLDNVGLPSVLIVGQRLSTGVANPGEIVQIDSLADGVIKAGVGSMLATMVRRFYDASPGGIRVFILPVDGNPSSVQATSTLTVTAPPTAAGLFELYIGGEQVEVPVTAGQTAIAIALSIRDAIDAATARLPITVPANNGTAAYTLTAKDRGAQGNGIDIRINANYGDKIPAGMLVGLSAFSGGTLTPALVSTTSALQAVFDNDVSGFVTSPVKWVVLGYNDASAVSAFNDVAEKMFGPTIQSGFRIFTAFGGASYSAITAYLMGKNYRQVSCLATTGLMTTAWDAAAIFLGAAAAPLFENPTRSLGGKALKGLRIMQSLTFEQRNSMLFVGGSTLEKGRDGTAYIGRVITMYTMRFDGSPDDAWLDINTIETFERVRRERNAEKLKRFSGMAVARTDEGFRPGLPVVTVDTYRAFLLSFYKERLMRELGWVQEYEYYRKTLIVELDPNNPTRINDFGQDVFINPFHGGLGRDQFRKAIPVV